VTSASEPHESARLRGLAGMRVVEWIGVEVGSIEATHGNYFQVRQADGTGFWLHEDCINTRNDHEVRLVFPGSQLERYRLAAPGLSD
jgi:hypothetical protein